jgi:hypothetical protein
MATNDTFEFACRGVVNGTQHIHTLHFRQVDPVLDGGNLITHWQTNCQTAYRGLFHNSQTPVLNLKAAKVCGATPLPAPVEVGVTGATTFGTRTTTGDNLPAFVACQVALKGTLAGKSRQGRFFLGGLWEADNVGNDLTAAYLLLVQAYIDVLKAQYVTGTPTAWQLVVHSRKLAAVPGTACQDSSDRVANIIANTRPTTMRSRKYGHGL